MNVNVICAGIALFILGPFLLAYAAYRLQWWLEDRAWKRADDEREHGRKPE